MLGDAIGDLLPSAIAVALSPAAIVAVIVLLGGPRGRARGSAFALGWIAGLAAVSVLVVLVLGGADDSDTASGSGWFKLAVGALFVAMAARRWRKRPRGGEPAELPRWMAGVDSLSAPKSSALGAGLSAANPKNLALTLAAATSIAAAGLDSGQTGAAIAVYVALGSATIGGPLALYLLSSERAERPLAAVRHFMTANNAVIMMVVLLLVGAKLIGDGLGAV